MYRVSYVYEGTEIYFGEIHDINLTSFLLQKLFETTDRVEQVTITFVNHD